LAPRGGITVELPNGIRLRTRDVSTAVAAILLLITFRIMRTFAE
jgi:hypothetical protein